MIEEDSMSTDLGFIISTIAAISAAGALLLNAIVHDNSRVWKRKEYVASLVKELKEGRFSGCALLMLDWSGRKVPLPIGENGATVPVTIDDNMVSASLIPHGYENRPRFGKNGAAIRDCFDSFLAKLTELEVMIQE